MIKYFDHVTICVHDLESARNFFGLLDFRVDKAVVITGERFADNMSIPGIDADHVTMSIPGLKPHLEVQPLHFRHPPAVADPNIARLDKLGFNHICFAVDDAAAMVESLRAQGVEVRSELAGFHDRLLYFVTGPEGITVELAQWD